MEVRQARHFLAVVEHGTTSRAARELHMTQPALSQSLVTLERSLKVPLFVRSTRGMTLTSAGEALVRPARQLIESSVRATAAVEGSVDLPRGTLTIAVMPALAAMPVASWIGRFHARYPQVRIQLLSYYADDAIETFIDRYAVDVLVAFDASPDAERIGSVQANSQEMVLALPIGTPVAQGRTVEISEIADLPFVVSPPNTSMRRLLDGAFAGIDAPLIISAESPFMDALPHLVAAGVGAALLPAEMIDFLRAAGCPVKYPSPPISRSYHLYYAKQQVSYAAQAFIRSALSRR